MDSTATAIANLRDRQFVIPAGDILEAHVFTALFERVIRLIAHHDHSKLGIIYASSTKPKSIARS